NNFGRVAFSGLSRIQHDKKLLLHLIEKSASVITIISLLFPVLIFGFGQEGTAILYTNKWLPGITALYWFAASTIFGGVIVALGQGILALGKSKNIFFITLIGNINNFIFSFLLL